MIITRIFGGLGNQLFQYSFARSLCIKYNRKLLIDKSFFNIGYVQSHPQVTQRKFKLDYFNTTYNLCPESISKAGKILSSKKLYYLTNYFSKHISHLPIIIKEKNFSDALINSANIVYLNDYWQSNRLITDYRKYLLKELIPSSNFMSNGEKILYKKILSTNSVSVHIRRGDYLKNSIPVDGFIHLRDNYYNQAISLTSKKVGLQNLKLFIFSDEIDWVKNNMVFKYDHVFVDKAISDYMCLFLMSNCRHNIIANSTFSWWAAWLNKNQNKIVIAPSHMKSKTINAWTRLISQEWITIPVLS